MDVSVEWARPRERVGVVEVTAWGGGREEARRKSAKSTLSGVGDTWWKTVFFRRDVWVLEPTPDAMANSW